VLTEVAIRLGGVLGQHGHADDRQAAGLAETAAAEITALGQRTRILELLTSVRADRAALAACAALSYRHPLGFDNLGLIDAAPRFSLRLHLWQPGSSRSVEHVHNHRFGFASVLLRGSYEMRIFRLGQTGTPVTEYREGLASRAAGWRLDQVGEAHVRQLAVLTLHQGSSYWIGPETLHRIAVPPAALCCTLFLETASVAPTTRVFTAPGLAVPASMARRTFSPDDYASGVDAVIAELSR
jgi:hypothetical protein